MALFELNIYGKDNEITKKYETDIVRWGVFMQALELQDVLKDKSAIEQFKLVSSFLKKIFPDLTDDDLDKADYQDVFNTFIQLANKANAIGGNSKNATGAAAK